MALALARGTLDRWIRAYREQGLSGLKPEPRSDLGTVKRHPELFDEACALRAELPTRSAAQIATILFARHRIRVAQRTINQHLRQRDLHRAALGGQPRAFGRFDASRPNELWIGDVLVGPFVPYPRTSSSRHSYLFVLLDDYSRLIVHARWVADQNTRVGQDVLRAAIQRRGVPERVYFDNGAPYSNAALERTCALLGIRLIHSRPYAPEGRGKLERLNRFIRERFLSEAEAHGIASFAELFARSHYSWLVSQHSRANCGSASSPRWPAHRHAVPTRADGPGRGCPIPPSPPSARRSDRCAVFRRRDRTATQAQPGAATRTQQRRHCGADRGRNRRQGAGR